MDHSQHRRSHLYSRGVSRLRRTSVLAVVLLTIVVPVFSSTAAAASGCGTYSFGFEGTRLINDGISNVSGPYPIDLPAGTYTVTLVAHDHHDRQVGVAGQPGEQYVVELDSGYTSPPSRDIPDDLILTTTIFAGQQISESSAITVRHGGVPGVNSVDVVCVGFTPEPESPTVPGVVFPNPLDPPADPSVERPTQDIGVPVGIVRNPDAQTPQPANPAPLEPDVLGVIESPPVAPQLAITGPGDHASQLVGAGVVLVLLGALLVQRQRRWDVSR